TGSDPVPRRKSRSWVLQHRISQFGFLAGRSISSYEGTWVVSDQDSRAAPQIAQTASPVCGTKNFSSVRLYSAPQLHCTIVTIHQMWASDRRFSSSGAYAGTSIMATRTERCKIIESRCLTGSPTFLA